MSPPLIAGAQAVGAVLSFKGNKAAAKSAEQIANYNATLAENEAVLLARTKLRQEEQLRNQSDALIGAQKVATAASGIMMSGNPLDAMANAYFGREMDVARLQHASNIEQLNKQSEATLTRVQGRAISAGMQTEAYASLLGGVSTAYATYDTLKGD